MPELGSLSLTARFLPAFAIVTLTLVYFIAGHEDKRTGIIAGYAGALWRL